MPTTENIVTLQSVKDALGLKADNLQHDKTLLGIINAVSRQIETGIGRFLTRQDHIEYFNSKDNQSQDYSNDPMNTSGVKTSIREYKLRLSGWPLVIDDDHPLRVYYDKGREFAAASQLVEGTDYIVVDDQATIVILTGTVRTVRGIKVSYSAGYEAEEKDGSTALKDVPADITEPTIMQVMAHRVKRRPDNAGLTGDRAEGSNGQGSFVQSLEFSTKGGLTPEVQTFLAHYRKPLMGNT